MKVIHNLPLTKVGGLISGLTQVTPATSVGLQFARFHRMHWPRELSLPTHLTMSNENFPLTWPKCEPTNILAARVNPSCRQTTFAFERV